MSGSKQKLPQKCGVKNKQRRFKPMKKGELRELYQMMFPEYPDIVTVKELR